MVYDDLTSISFPGNILARRHNTRVIFPPKETNKTPHIAYRDIFLVSVQQYGRKRPYWRPSQYTNPHHQQTKYYQENIRDGYQLYRKQSVRGKKRKKVDNVSSGRRYQDPGEWLFLSQHFYVELVSET